MRSANERHRVTGVLQWLATGVVFAALAAPAGAQTAFDDRWLSVMAMEELSAAAKTQDWSALDKRAGKLIVQRLSCGNLDKLEGLNDLVYISRAARFLPMADKADASGKLTAWLVANRPVSRLLFRALQDVESPSAAIANFQTLLAADEKRVLAYANLAVAFATSQPLEHYVKQPDACTMLESFAWFTTAKGLRYDLKAMPYELSRYLADTRLSLAERDWVVQKYGAAASLEAAYFDINFDYDYFFDGAPKKITKLPYTMANLRKVGGVCIDQAYFTSELCKVMGVPSTIVIGRNAAGGGHGWVASLKMRQSGGKLTVEWDTNTGRYEEQKFYTGTLVDPASQKKLHDSELALLGAAALLELDRREQADAATALAALVAPKVESPPADVSDLKKLADDFNKTFAPKTKLPKADPAQLKATQKFDAAMVEALLVEAAKRNLAHRQVWDLAIQLRKAGNLSNECIDRMFELLVSKTAKDYPDYSCNIVLQLMPTFDDPAKRMAIFNKSMTIYAQRPDLQGQLLIACGDDLAKQGKGQKEQALKVYKQAMAGKTREVTEVLVMAAQHAEQLLTDDKRADEAVKMYQDLFGTLKKPDVDGGYPQSAYYLLGKRLAELLADANQTDASKKIYDKIGKDFEPALKTP